MRPFVRISAGLVAMAACTRAPAPVAAPAPAPAAAPSLDPMSEASIAADLAWLTDPAQAGRGSRTPDGRRAAAWVAGQLRAAGYRPTEQPIPAAPGQVNVLAIANPGAPGPAVAVVAHVDHLGVVDGRLYPGADDNASGVACALAAARDLAHRPAGGRVLWLFTGAEEVGLLGARAYVAAPAFPLAELRAVYNLDMVGREITADGAPQLAGVGLPGDDAVLTAALDAAAAAGLALAPVRAGMVRVIGQDQRTDDWPFRDAGVHAVHFSTGAGDAYHRPEDTADTVSPRHILRCARFLRALVVTNLRVRRRAPPPRRSARRRRAR